MVEGGRHRAAGVPHRRGGGAALAVSVGVAGGVPMRQPDAARVGCPAFPLRRGVALS